MKVEIPVVIEVF